MGEATKSPHEAGQPPAKKRDVKPPPQESATGEQSAPAPPPFVVTRSGNLIFVTDKAFKFDALRPADSKLLNEDQNFRQAHERFSTEPVFIFFNVALKDMNAPQPATEAELEQRAEAQRKAEAEANEQHTDEMTPDPEEPQAPEATPENESPVRATVTVQEQPTAGLS